MASSVVVVDGLRLSGSRSGCNYPPTPTPPLSYLDFYGCLCSQSSHFCVLCPNLSASFLSEVVLLVLAAAVAASCCEDILWRVGGLTVGGLPDVATAARSLLTDDRKSENCPDLGRAETLQQL